ncbi:hypothetical protein AB1Y20_014300 [Prymnesium parvum]|uniref:YqgF/RNase H-like domain-containing protein n=1 Tax=Prymnesium parvum TaxID=97485 RepID=A0AB34IFU6_PRYPA
MAAHACLPALLALSSSPPPRARGLGTRTLGVDYGLRRVGVALGTGYAPQPLCILSVDSPHAAAARLCAIAAAEGAEQLVVGLPYTSSGGEGEQALLTRAFARLLAEASPRRPVFLWDERFSSAEAAARMHAGRGAARGEALDAAAAAVILESFFDGEHSRAEWVAVPPPPPPPPRLTAPPPTYSELRARMQARAAEQGRGAPPPAGRARKRKR